MQIPYNDEELQTQREMIRLRRDFHAHPEEGWCEFRTTAAIVRVLENLGFAVLTGEGVIAPDARMGVVEERLAAARLKALEEGADATILDRMGDLTGCVGVWKTGRPGPRHSALPLPSRTSVTSAGTTPTRRWGSASPDGWRRMRRNSREP